MCYSTGMRNVSKAMYSLKLRAFRPEFRRGQTLVEYALILAIISVVAIGALVSLSQGIKGIYSSITSTISSANSSH